MAEKGPRLESLLVDSLALRWAALAQPTGLRKESQLGLPSRRSVKLSEFPKAARSVPESVTSVLLTARWKDWSRVGRSDSQTALLTERSMASPTELRLVPPKGLPTVECWDFPLAPRTERWWVRPMVL